MSSVTQPGTFSARVLRTRLHRAKTGTPQIAITFETDAGETTTCYRALTAAAWRAFVKEDLEILGWDPGRSDFEVLDTDESPLVGAVCEIVCQEDGANIRVKFINAPGGGGKRLSAEELKTFAADVRRDLGFETREEQTPHDFDDIPF